VSGDAESEFPSMVAMTEKTVMIVHSLEDSLVHEGAST